MRLNRRHQALLSTSAITLSLLLPNAAFAADDGIIIVTAQKREQNVQDVPIAVTALGGDALQANRVASVMDLTGLAPGLTAMATAGGTKVPQFTMRGTYGNGVVPGADRQVGIYIDGVYIASSRGGVFDLPDISRIEVLRGPQGTLFGRNATAGAVSIYTRDPTGEAGAKILTTVGNYGQLRVNASIDLPQVGPFSGYVSFVHNERRGDIRNTAVGQVWDRTSSAVERIAKIQRSPKYLGSENAESWFAALKFESGDFTTVYKYDRLRSMGTPPGTGFIGFLDFPPYGDFFRAIINSQAFEVPITPSGKRPKAVANGFAVDLPQSGDGHSLTSTYQFSDSLSAKNIFSFRKSFIFGTSPLGGISGLILTPEAVPGLAQVYGGIPEFFLTPLIGSPFVGVSNQTQGRTKQISDELQFNFESDFLTATAGALWFNAKDWTAENFQKNTNFFVVFPGGVIPNSDIGRTFNEVTSLAAYAQLEFHVSEKMDLILGGRITNDKKKGSFLFGPDLDNLTLVNFSYKKTKPTYLIGVNFKPRDGLLVYAKFSTAYVSGGSTAGVDYVPETAKSLEGGVKAEFFNGKLLANLALYHVKYSSIQGANSTTTPGYADYVLQRTGNPAIVASIGTFVTNSADLKATGAEFDFTARPVDGLTLGGSLSYNDSSLSNIDPLVQAANGGFTQPNFTPDWTASFWGQYDTPPIGAGGAYVSFRIDGNWKSDLPLTPNPRKFEYQVFARNIAEVPAYAIINGRIALKDLEVGGARIELAVWGKNLTNNRSANYALNLGVLAGANYIAARTVGADVLLEF